MKKFKVLIFILVLSFTGSAQQTYFNNLYKYNNTNCNAMCCIETVDGFLVLGNSSDSSNPFWTRAGILKLSENGSKQWSEDFGDTIHMWYVGLAGSVHQLSDSSYILAGARVRYNPNHIAEGLMLSFDEQGDTIWSKVFTPDSFAPLDTFLTCQYLFKNKDFSYVMAGIMYPNSGQDKIAITKFDSLGNVLSIMGGYGYGGNYKTRGLSVKELKDKGYIIGAYSYQPGFDETVDPVLYKVDSAGGLEWFKGIGGPWMDDLTYLALASDSTFVCGTAIAAGMFSNEHRYRLRFQKYDMHGTLIWSKTVGPERFDRSFSNLIRLSDGSFVACGSAQVNNSVRWTGWLMKIKAFGDSVWYREVENLSGFQSFNYLQDIIECTDGGLLACGQVFPALPDTGTNAAWVIKLDSLGCPYPNCDSTNSVSEITAGNGFTMNLWPNPAKDVLHVDCSFPGKNPVEDVEILNSFGSLLIRQSVSVQSASFQLDVRSLDPGLYILLVSGKNQLKIYRKFLIIR